MALTGKDTAEKNLEFFDRRRVEQIRRRRPYGKSGKGIRTESGELGKFV